MRLAVGTTSLALLAAVLAAPAPSAAAPSAAAPGTAPAVGSDRPGGSLSERPVPSLHRVGADRRAPVASLDPTRTEPFGLVGVTWDAAGAPEAVDAAVRLRSGGAWRRWLALEPGADGPGGPEASAARPGTAPLWVGRATGVAVRVTAPGGGSPDGVRVVTVAAPDRRARRADRSVAKRHPASGDAITRPPRFPGKPRVITRHRWGADPRLSEPCWRPRYGSTAKMVFVHHTAGSSRYSPQDSPAIVRGIYAYHTQGQDWCDIGYNALVDRFGNIYEGRRGGIRKPVRGAHAGDWNTNTVGVSLMGNFEQAKPTKRIRNALVRFTGWRLGTSFVPVRGRVRVAGERFARISGHRDAMSTSCPGSNVYDRLPRIRHRVATYLSRYHSAAERKADRLGRRVTGKVFVGEQWKAGGTYTTFGKGRVYANDGSGARWLRGRVLARFRGSGGVDGRLGWPQSDRRPSQVRDMALMGFTKGRMYVPRDQHRIKLLYGRILARYARLGYARGRLGAPRTSVHRVDGGARAVFAHAVVRWDRSRDRVTVRYR